MSRQNVLLVNWGTSNAEYALKQSLDLKKEDLFLATTPFLHARIRNLFSPENLIYTNPYDSQRLIEDVAFFVQNKKIHFGVVTTFFEMNVYQASVLAAYLKCKRCLPPSVALKTSVNKYLMRLALSQSGLVQPRFEVFDEQNLKKAFVFYQQIKKPAVIKPVHSGHGYGARFVEKNLSFCQFFHLYQKAKADLNRNYDEWMNYENLTISRRFLIEEFIGGKLISCDGVVSDKGHLEFIGATEFNLSQPPFLDQTGHLTPPVSLSQKQIKQGLNYAHQAVLVLGLQYCGFHCEIKYDDNQPYLVEISGRLPGGTVLQAYQETSPQNIFGKFFSVFEEKKEKIIPNPVFFKSEVTHFFFSRQKFGRIKEIKIPHPEENKKFEVLIDSLREKETFGSLREERGAWLLTLTLRSKILNQLRLKKEMNTLAQKIKIEIEDNLGILLKIFLKKLIQNYFLEKILLKFKRK